MTFYFGKPAAGLVALPHPLRGIVPSSDRNSTIHTSSAGGRVVDMATRTRRTWSLAWSWLDTVTFSTLEEFFTGGRGPGPFALLDPGRRNHLTANQSATTSASNDATGFAVAAGSGELLASADAPILRGPRSLRWSLPPTVTSGVLNLDPPQGLFGFPIPAGTPWTWSGQVSSAGLPSVTITPVLSWRRADGSEVSATSGTPVAAVVGAWTAFSVSLGTPPAGALYVRPQLRITPGVLVTAATGTDVTDIASPPSRYPAVSGRVAVAGPNSPLVAGYSPRGWGASYILVDRAPAVSTDVLVDQLMLDMFATARTWVVGTGVPMVSMTSLRESYRLLPDRDVTATFVEVG